MSPQLSHRRDPTDLDAPDPTDVEDRMTRVEQYGIGYIPDDERFSRPLNLSFILFGGSLTFSLFIIGWFPIAFGLGWWSSFTSVVVGSLVGALLLAPMGLMGPRAGTNNPVSSGALFGVVGRLIGTFLEASASVAFAALSIWTGGDALVGGLDRFFGLQDNAATRVLCYGVLSVIVTVISIYGHNMMVGVQRFMVPTAGLLVILGVFVYAGDFDASYGGTPDAYAIGSFWPTWLLSALISLSTVTSYGPYAGDWTRHISRKRFSDRSILIAMFTGGLIGMGGSFLWGTYTATAIFASGKADADTLYVFGLVDAAPLWYVPALIYLGLASGTAQAVINTYGTGLDTSSIIPRLNRIQATGLACAVATVLVYLGYFFTGLVDSVATFLSLLAVFSVPWIVAMIIGFVHRRGFYHQDDLQVFNRGERGGRYWFKGGLNWRAVGPWLVGASIGLLFTNTAWFVGPGTDLTDGTDIGFAVAAVIVAIFYPLALRLFPEPPYVFEGGGAEHEVTPVTASASPLQPDAEPAAAGRATGARVDGP
jgi:purine-cytosine permease-like protein